MPLTKDSTVISQKIVDMLNANLGALGLQKVYYGDPAQIPAFPAVQVESGPKDRSLDRRDASSHRWPITLISYITVFHERIQDIQTTRKQNEQLVESIENVLHGNLQMDGLVIFGYVTRTEPGIAVRPDKIMMRATRMTWEGISRETF